MAGTRFARKEAALATRPLFLLTHQKNHLKSSTGTDRSPVPRDVESRLRNLEADGGSDFTSFNGSFDYRLTGLMFYGKYFF